MNRIILILVFILFIYQHSLGQISVKAGIILANQATEFVGGAFSGGHKLGPLVGFNYKHSLSRKFFLRPGLQYSPKGNEVSFLGTTFQNNSNYLELPIDLVFSSRVFSVHSGLYLSYLISSTTNNLPNKENLNPLDFGINIGLAANYNQFGIGANYGYGLTDVSKNIRNFGFLRNKVFHIYLILRQ